MPRRLMTAAALAVAATLTLSAQDAARPVQFSPERFRAHVTFLADDLLEGREAGTRGHEIAARYIASEFAQLGVRPGAAGGTYYQPVDLLESNPVGEPVVTARTSHGSRKLRPGVDVLAFGPAASGTSRVSGDVVYVGYGVTDPTLGIDDYKSLDVRGKIVLVLAGPVPGIDSEIAAHLLSEQRAVAAAHGAVGFLAVQTRGAEKVTPFEVIARMRNAPATTWVHKDGTPEDILHGMKASALLSHKAAPQMFDGAPKTFDQVLDDAEKPGAHPAGFPLKTRVDVTLASTARRYSSPDVVGMIEGSDPLLRNEYVALMAHADHIGMQASGSGDRINNGALDNGAGVATLLEVARAFATSPERPKRTILLVANTAEEKGLLGATSFANNPPVPADRIVAAIDLDMPLLLYDFTDVVAYGGSHSTVDKAFEAAGHEMGVALSPDPMPEQTIFVRSDHYAMARVGIPAVMLATGMAHGGDKAWADFLSTHYHRPSDDLSLPIHWGAGAKFAELNYRAVRVLADSQEPARWYAGDYFGNRFAPNAKKAPR